MSGIPSDIPHFQILSVWILVLGHYLFIRACSFSWALLSNVLGVGVILILEPGMCFMMLQLIQTDNYANP